MYRFCYYFCMAIETVEGIADVRDNLSRILKGYRSGDVSHVIIGAHRKPEAVIVPYQDYIAADSGFGRVIHLETVQSFASIIKVLATVHHLSDVCVFGPVAKGMADTASDVDLLVTTDPDANLFDVADFEEAMEELLKNGVNVVPRSTLQLPRDNHIVREAVTLWNEND